MQASPPTNDNITEKKQSASSTLLFLRYALRRGLVIALTIVIGVYLTVIVANAGGEVDNNMWGQVEVELRELRWSGFFDAVPEDEYDAAVQAKRQELAHEIGLDLPDAARNLLWTYKALHFDWGRVLHRVARVPGASSQDQWQVNEIIKAYFPNTLLLVGVADFLVLALGIPLALSLATLRRGQWLDRLIAMLAPLSSVPSWVHGIILVMIFAMELHWLPTGGKFHNIPPDTWAEEVIMVGRHMILPVLAIFMSMFFQLVYSWRTFFLIYAEEDYVDLALAKGLKPRKVRSSYILKPTMPYILTSFALTLVGFWQMTTALEYFFNWPGIGQLYVVSLPNFWGEFYFPGEMGIILSIVVVFAYLLGMIVFLLDIAYAWLDPRVRMGSGEQRMRLATDKRRFWQPRDMKKTRPAAWAPTKNGKNIKDYLDDIQYTLRLSWGATQRVLREIRRYPSAMLGLFIISLMLIASIYTVIGLPYTEIGEAWDREALVGKVYTPRNAPPEWVNFFRANDLPTTLVLSSQDSSLERSVTESESGNKDLLFSASFEYSYQEFPQDMLLYIEPTYQEKRPFIAITWTTPDGRTINLKNASAEPGTTYFFSDHVSVNALLTKNPLWREWFVTTDPGATAPFYLLFADPEADTARALPGTYRLEISALTFEPEADVEIEFVMVGRVFGLAGTDFLRRDLMTPLLWGMPFALAFGMTGAVLTTVFSMIFSAAGVWLGGWVDNLIQRLTEANMILPVLAVGILVYALYGIDLWIILGVVILLNVFGSPTKAFRAAFLQVKEAPYMESARAYGASNLRIIFRYLIPRIIPVMIPQMVTLIPSFVFLEATLGIFNVFDPRYPTWGRIIYTALSKGAWWGGSRYWVLEPISLLLLTGLAFALVGFALERILNPRLQEK